MSVRLLPCKTFASQELPTQNHDFLAGLGNLSHIMDSVLQHVDWRHDGPYTWPVSEELKHRIRQIREERTWPDEYHEEPVRIDRLVNLLKHVCGSQSVIDVRNNLGKVMITWYTQRLKGDCRRSFEAVPAFSGRTIFQLRVRAHPLHKDFYIIDVGGTEVLVGALADWVVFNNGIGSTLLVIEKGVTVPVQFNIEHLVMYGGLMQTLSNLTNATED